MGGILPGWAGTREKLSSAPHPSFGELRDDFRLSSSFQGGLSVCVQPCPAPWGSWPKLHGQDVLDLTPGVLCKASGLGWSHLGPFQVVLTRQEGGNGSSFKAPPNPNHSGVLGSWRSTGQTPPRDGPKHVQSLSLKKNILLVQFKMFHFASVLDNLTLSNFSFQTKKSDFTLCSFKEQIENK